jgi:hypothetical protein
MMSTKSFQGRFCKSFKLNATNLNNLFSGKQNPSCKRDLQFYVVECRRPPIELRHAYNARIRPGDALWLSAPVARWRHIGA